MRSSYFDEISQFTEKPEEAKRQDAGAGRQRDSQVGSGTHRKTSPAPVAREKQ